MDSVAAPAANPFPRAMVVCPILSTLRVFRYDGSRFTESALILNVAEDNGAKIVTMIIVDVTDNIPNEAITMPNNPENK